MSTNTNVASPAANLRANGFSIIELISRISATRRQRLKLRNLDTDALKDIGLTRSAADAEASRPVWDVPSNWLR